MAGYPFACTVHERDDAVIVIELHEAITSDAAPRLCDTLRAITQGRNAPSLVLDLCDCDTVCSTGLGVIHFIQTNIKKTGGTLVVARATEFVSEVIRATLGQTLVLCIDTVEGAVEASVSARSSAVAPTGVATPPPSPKPDAPPTEAAPPACH